jgi:hypothetical protein
MRRAHSFICAAAFAALSVVIVYADEPLPPPSRVTVTSLNGQIRVVSDPKAGTQIEDVKGHKVLWRLPDWYRLMFVSNDGRYLVTPYGGGDLIPTNFRGDFVLITSWHEGRKIKDVTARDLFLDPKILNRTASHYEWGGVEGIDSNGWLKVERVGGKRFLFDVTTGTAINR